MDGTREPTEPSITMTRKDKRDLLLASIAIVVTVIVVGALIAPPPPPPEEPDIKASITPDTVYLAAGQTVALDLSIADGDTTWLNPPNVQEWMVNPEWLGEIHEPGPQTFRNKSLDPVRFTAGRNATSGNVTCTVAYQGKILIATANITVGPPVIDDVRLTPSDYRMLVGRNITFELIVQNSLNERVFNFGASWSLAGMNLSDYQMNRTSGPSIRFQPNAPGKGELTALVAYESDLMSCNTTVEAMIEPPRTVNYRWYDMFNVSLGPWYEKRWEVYGKEMPMSAAYPWLLQSNRGDGIKDTYGGMRLNITGRNLTGISMNERPVFLPYLGDERGGNVIIDWYMQYLTAEELADRYQGFEDADDGWIIVLNGTVTLDVQAAKGVLNLTDEGYDGFDGWWESNEATVIERYSRWIALDEPLRIDLEDTYGWYFQLFTFGLQASRAGDKIVLSYDLVTWGVEVEMMKWLHEAFLPTEWWFEDMEFHARIGPYLSDFDIDAAVTRAVRASNSTENGKPCWIWEAMKQSPVPYDTPHLHIDGSGYDSPYYRVNQRYMDMGGWVLPWDPMPGGLPFTQTPGSFNLTQGERLRFEWPAGQVVFRAVPFGQNWTNISTEIVLGYFEPNETDVPPDQRSLNLTERHLDFYGPIDFWTWSKDQTDHLYLAEKWQSYGLLPYGMPYLEFWPVV